MDLKGYFTSFIFILPGLIAVLAALFDWSWFFSTRSASFFVDTFGRAGARLFYGMLGLLFIVAAIMILQSLFQQPVQL